MYIFCVRWMKTSSKIGLALVAIEIVLVRKVTSCNSMAATNMHLMICKWFKQIKNVFLIQFSAAYLNWRQLNLDQEHRFEMGQSWWGCYLLEAYYRSVSIKFKLVHFVCIGILPFAEWASIWIPAVRCVTLTSRLGKVKANQRRWKSNFLFCEKGEPFFFLHIFPGQY